MTNAKERLGGSIERRRRKDKPEGLLSTIPTDSIGINARRPRRCRRRFAAAPAPRPRHVLLPSVTIPAPPASTRFRVSVSRAPHPADCSRRPCVAISSKPTSRRRGVLRGSVCACMRIRVVCVRVHFYYVVRAYVRARTRSGTRVCSETRVRPAFLLPPHRNFARSDHLIF